MEAMQLKECALLQGGKYRIESVLGQGGFGITYLAMQTDLNRKVAIKEFFMKIHCNRDEGTSHVSVPSVGSRAIVDKFKAKFIKEAQTIAAMENEHIIKIHETFEENGTAYYVMEYINGGSLSDCIPSGGFPEDIALKYIHQIARTLQYVHEEKHILHLDVKPSNILLRKSDMVVLIDFGISKHYDTAGDAQTSTTPVGVSVGYAPKEQYKLGGVSQFSPATDIYSLGATLYKLLTGQTPPDALDVDERGLSDLPEHISASVRAAVVKATKPQREDRPQSVAEFLSLLDAAAAEERNEEDESEEDEIVVQGDQDETDVVVSDHDEPTPVPPVPAPGPVPGPAPRKRRLWLWLLLLALVAGVLAAVVFTGKKDDAEQAAAQVPLVDDERSRFESDYNDYKTAMEMGSEYEKTESTLSQAKGKYESAQKIEQRWSNSRTYSSRFNLGASASLKRVEKRLNDIAAEAVAKEKAEEEAKKAEEAKRAAARTHGTISSHQWVDLGLPSGLKWATCNVGASSPEDYGDYYAWGELSTKDEYTESNCSTYEKQIGNISGNPQYDVARNKWGGSWRMPTKEELDELRKQCTWVWTTKGGHKGHKVTGPNGNSIFLPAAGCRNGADTCDAESYGLYWGATPNESVTQGAYGLLFSSGPRGTGWLDRYYGRSVRPVSD